MVLGILRAVLLNYVPNCPKVMKKSFIRAYFLPSEKVHFPPPFFLHPTISPRSKTIVGVTSFSAAHRWLLRAVLVGEEVHFVADEDDGHALAEVADLHGPRVLHVGQGVGSGRRKERGGSDIK